ncbi:hypothetical protein ACB098_01G090400 [Castanea mollissima]
MLGSSCQGLELREGRWRCRCGMYVREKQREMKFAILDNGKWKSGGILKFGIFRTSYVRQRSSGDNARQWLWRFGGESDERVEIEKNFDFQKKENACCFNGGL